MGEKTKTQWHGPFVAAMKLELRADKTGLEYQSEVPLNTKPIQLDLLIIKKSSAAAIHNEIGRIFRGHNIFEYKSPDDELGIDEYFKTLAYACLYKTSGSASDRIRADDVTVSLVRERKPILCGRTAGHVPDTGNRVFPS